MPSPSTVRWISCALAGLIQVSCSDPDTSAADQTAPDLPDVVLIVVDTLRADRLPFHGCERDNAPFLSSLAETAHVFDNAWSTSSWTAPSTASILTGLYPFQHGVLTGLIHYQHDSGQDAEVRLNRLPDEALTIAESLRELGYRTFGVTDNPNITERMGFDQGFDRFAQLDYEGAEAVNEQLLAWEDELRGGGPFFVYLHYMDPHAPYNRRTPWFDAAYPAPVTPRRTAEGEALAERKARSILRRGANRKLPPLAAEDPLRWLSNAYDSEIRHMDEHVQEIFERLEIGDDALVVFTADHGEEFLDHGGLAHGFQLYSELVQVPMFVRIPGDAAQTRSGNAVTTVDILPTLCALLGAPGDQRSTGVNLLESSERTLYASRDAERGERSLRALVRGHHKLVVTRPEGALELYDLSVDPGEQRDLAQEQPELTATMKAELERIETASPRLTRQFSDPVTLSEAELEKLGALGYVEGDDEEN